MGSKVYEEIRNGNKSRLMHIVRFTLSQKIMRDENTVEPTQYPNPKDLIPFSNKMNQDSLKKRLTLEGLGRKSHNKLPESKEVLKTQRTYLMISD